MQTAADLRNPSVDVDRHTGELIAGWPHVVQSLEVVFTTVFGERIMREWFGSMVPRLLGELMNEDTIVTFFTALASAVDQWEPRFKIKKITPLSLDRLGAFSVEITGEYRPRALLGDFAAEGGKRIVLNGAEQGVRITA
ncbi:hypothetical protein SAMN05892877_13230 [Rhizobium subbaraonis]|uniref:IraD/Gp25-like domain-containing protein n=1 Tax=Rhizobium subbaraonis TaxID=908946 RepID=A0A285V0V2_9HYPH|nr:GPW/gp25 family protein [Rhizobium subbaraonis]SOC47692.1 hypothetical protein SAMN05892877_13230 [Rhizobium subbaraonis]